MSPDAKEVSAGGVVLWRDRVLILKNHRGEWVLPKGKVEPGESLEAAALREVKEEAGVDATIIGKIGETSYHYCSESSGARVDKRVHWYLMEASNGEYALNSDEGFSLGGFVDSDEATAILTFDGALVESALRKLKAGIGQSQMSRRGDNE